MPSLLKRRGLLPVEDSVAIPDVVFPQPVKAAEPPSPEWQDDDAGAAVPETDTEAVFPDEAEPSAAPAAPDLTPEELEAVFHEELEALRQQAAQQGWREAHEEAREAIQSTLEKVDATLSDMQRMQDSFIRKYGSTLKYTALEIAEKFTDQRIEADDAVLVHLVTQTVAAVKNAEWLNVEVSDRLEQLIAALREELSAPKYQGRVSVTPISAPDGTCRVTSSEGTLDSSIHVQAQNLRSVFDGMADE